MSTEQIERDCLGMGGIQITLCFSQFWERGFQPSLDADFPGVVLVVPHVISAFGKLPLVLCVA